MLPDWYPALAALHILFMVAFFSATFHLLHLLLRHRQALMKPEPDRTILAKQFAAMERIPLLLVAWPSLILLVITGGWMAWYTPSLLAKAWVQAKLGLTALLFAYHLVNHRLIIRMRRGEAGWNYVALLVWAQGAALMLIVAVFLSVFKQVDWYIGLLGLVVLATLLYSAIRAFGAKNGETAPPDRTTGAG